MAGKFSRVHAPGAAAFCQLRQIGFGQGFQIVVVIQVAAAHEKSPDKHSENDKSARIWQGVAPNWHLTRLVAQ